MTHSTDQINGSYFLKVTCPSLPVGNPEPVVIDVLWGKVATKVVTLLAKTMNLVLYLFFPWPTNC
jgi:hypothetical protein